MQQSGARYVTEAEVASVLDLDGAIVAYRRALAAWHELEAMDLPKTQMAWGAATLHALGGALTDPTCLGVKAWAHTPDGTEPTLLIWHHDGTLRAIVEAFVLGQFRTAAGSAIATDQFAVADASTLAIIGSGRQAQPQVAAVVRVRPIEVIRVYSPTVTNRDGFAASLREALPGIKVVTCNDVASAVADAKIVTLATRATAPILSRADVAAGTHVNAIGAITPDRIELAADLVAQADVVVSDSPELALANASELRQVSNEARPAVLALRDAVGRDICRPTSRGITVFKAMGTGLGDVAIGAHVLDALRPGGTRVGGRRRVAPRLFG